MMSSNANILFLVDRCCDYPIIRGFSLRCLFVSLYCQRHGRRPRKHLACDAGQLQRVRGGRGMHRICTSTETSTTVKSLRLTAIPSILLSSKYVTGTSSTSAETQVVWSIMSKWMQAESSPSSVRVLDMAAGRYVGHRKPPAHCSGEVTEALLEWEKAHRQSPPANITTPFNSRAFIPPNARRLAAPTLRLPDAFNLDIVATDPVGLRAVYILAD